MNLIMADRDKYLQSIEGEQEPVCEETIPLPPELEDDAVNWYYYDDISGKILDSKGVAVKEAYRKRRLLGFLDVKRAHFYSDATRELYVELPAEAKKPGEDVVGKLLKSLYGTRDAPLNWELQIQKVMTALGFKQGKSNPCIYYHSGAKVKTPLAKGSVEDLKDATEYLNDEEATQYRSVAMRAAYLAQDRPDLQVATRNLTDYRCDVELIGCDDLQPGQSCTVACAMPYSGASVTALCPQDNGDESAQPILQGELNCVLDSCNATDEVPVGYVKTHDGWKCDEGYGGTPAVHCGFSPAGAFQGGRGCGLEMHPSGCKPLVPCVPPSSLEGCKYDTSNCGSVLPGQECQLKCRKPYSGLGVFATCLGDNTDPTQAGNSNGTAGTPP
eukprot:s264_g19.t1